MQKVDSHVGQSIGTYIGLSTDTKPTDSVYPGETFYETDTGRTHVFDGTAWSASEAVPNKSSVAAVILVSAVDGLSAAIDLGEIDCLVGFVSPAAWTAAALTFLASHDGVTYASLYDSDGSEVAIASGSIPTAASRFIAFTSDLIAKLAGIRYLKLRSGTAALAVQQGATRTLQLVLRQV
jgi:hypothetical protein